MSRPFPADEPSTASQYLIDLLQRPERLFDRDVQWKVILLRLPQALREVSGDSVPPAVWSELRKLLHAWDDCSFSVQPWEWKTLSQELSDAARVAHSVEVPIAVCDMSAWEAGGKEGGHVVKLVLDVLRDGSGLLEQSACNVLLVKPDSSFRESMETAWIAAGGKGSKRDGRWRVEGMTVPIEGPSAGAAAACGWRLALEEEPRYPDPCLIVMATIDIKGRLGDVDKDTIPAKLAAVERRMRWDTVVFSRAQAFAGYPDAPNLEDLVRLGSHYLSGLANNKDISEIKVAGLPPDKDGLPKDRLPIEAFYISLKITGSREGTHAEPTALEAISTMKRVVVHGLPGSGKSTLLRMVALTCCRGKLPLLPIWIRLRALDKYIEDWRGTGGIPGADDPEWMVRFLAKQRQSFGFFAEWLRDPRAIILLDGLDEVDSDRRARIASLIAKAASRDSGYENARYIVTTRPGAYHGAAVVQGFGLAGIGPLDIDAMRAFSRKLSALLFLGPGEKANESAERLLEDLRGKPAIMRMAGNPMMLTALVSVHWRHGKLPEMRAELYEQVLQQLVNPDPVTPPPRLFGKTGADCLEIYQTLALAMQSSPANRIVIEKGVAEKAVSRFFANNERDAGAFLEADLVTSGILREHEEDKRCLEFWHSTFREFLAARAISYLNQDDRVAFICDEKRLNSSEWREVVLLLGGILIKKGPGGVHAIFKEVLNRAEKDDSLKAKARAVGLLGAMLTDLRPWKFDPPQRYNDFLEASLAIFKTDKPGTKPIPFNIRLEAAEALGQAGDPRLKEDNWVTIPPGTFYRGAQKENSKAPNYDPEAFDDESPVLEVPLEKGYRIRRYPVTVQEYLQFVEEDGYVKREYWEKTGGFGEFKTPGRWEEQLEHPNRPVTDVSWYEAAAYCASVGCRLPTEEEWERAARGPGGCQYPWGNKPKIDETRANFDGKVGHPTPVGLYPGGETGPEAWGTPLSDMLGNVWEWTADWYGPYGKPSEKESRVVRGGSWGDYPGSSRVSCRDDFRPAYRNYIIGFRCAGELS